MTSADLEHNDKLLAKEKLEWVTPKISLMGAEASKGGKHEGWTEDTNGFGQPTLSHGGPS
jgi:hypothetical protein